MSVMPNHMTSGAVDLRETKRTELDERQRDQLLFEWNETATAFPKGLCVHELFAEQARLRADAEAVVIGDQSLTYAELDSRANQLAHYLQDLGIGPEVVVGLCMERSLEMVIGLLAILKAGGAYLPLDRNYPSEHLSYLLKDAGVSVVLSSPETDATLARHEIRTVKLDPDWRVFLDQPRATPATQATSQNLAYVMYTSGSSGKPKGVGVVHSNINRLVRKTNYIDIGSDEVFLQLAPVTFDAATFEIWGALLNGATLVLYPPDPMLDLMKLKRIIQDNRVSVLWLTAGLFHRVVDTDLEMLSPVRKLLAGGDVISATHVKKVIEGISGCRVINGYGPTEGTTFSICFPVPDAAAIGRMVPIGRPVSNSAVYVLDSELEPVPIRATGELYIGGAGLSRCYFQRPDLTAESFLPNPFGASGSRLYRTGDLVRYSEDGLLEFIGRVDLQVKVRGYRVELEEVDAALLLDPSIRQAAAVALQDAKGDKRLVAYVVGAADAAPDAKKLRENLSSHLPEYMIPSTFVALKELPLTANGKVDRKALPQPEWSASNAVLAQNGGIEQAVAEIWAAALGVKEVGLEDDFFDLGGTSLALINIVVEMSKRFGFQLDTSIVSRGATVSALAQAVKEKMTAGSQTAQPVEQAVAEIWAAALGVKQVGLEDDFFDLGGTSLALINIVVEMSKRFGFQLDTSIVSRGATVSALAQAVKEKMTAGSQTAQPVEQAVAEIWAAALGVKQVGLEDDFFDLGGTSLALINIVVEMSKRFGIPLDTSIVSRGATVSALAQALKEQSSSVVPSSFELVGTA